MKTYKVSNYEEDKSIELNNLVDLPELYENIINNEDFIIEYTENKKVRSKLIIANIILAKVKNGEFELKAKEELKEK